MIYDIFLSYSRRDAETMIRIKGDLESEGLHVWTDEGIEIGTLLWKDAIEKAIENAGCLIVILSPSAKQSIWVKRELDYADAHKVKTFPLLALGDESSSIPFSVIGSQYVDLRSNYDQGFQCLVHTVARYLKVVIQSEWDELRTWSLEAGESIVSQMSKISQFDFEAHVTTLKQAEATLATIRQMKSDLRQYQQDFGSKYASFQAGYIYFSVSMSGRKFGDSVPDAGAIVKEHLGKLLENCENHKNEVDALFADMDEAEREVATIIKDSE